MTVDPQRLLGARLPERTSTWGPDELLLYHLALGAGADPTCPHELHYTYERDLTPLPTYGSVLAVAMLMQVFDLPGLDFDPEHVLHASHELLVERPLPCSATVRHTGCVEALYDQGRHALAVVRVDSRDATGGELLFVNRYTLFLAGQGGFGGERGPASAAAPPERAPDATRLLALSPQQALLFRLTGDRHPIHVDPEMARRRGFERPILHGLCSFGMAGKFVVDTCCGGDVQLLTGLRARFAKAVYPGETLRLDAWRDGAQVRLQATCLERDVRVLSNGLATLKG